MSKTVREYPRVLFRAVAVYAAGAWVAVEVVEFAVRQYGLTQFLVDAAVIVAFGGGMVTAVLVWFHGESGRQKVPPSEILVVSGIVVATVSGLLYLNSGGPTKAFDDLPGYRLVLEYRELPGKDDDGHIFMMSPIPAIEKVGDIGIFSLAPEDGSIRGSLIRAQFEDHPTMFVESLESDFVKVIFILPYEPTDLSDMISLGTTHDSAKIDTAGLSIQIESSVAITKQDNGATIRLVNGSGPSSSKQ